MVQATTVTQLQRRIHEMQSLRLPERALPTSSELRKLLPHGTLRRGSVVSVQGSVYLTFALIAELSASGAWCSAVGLPSLGVEAIAKLKIALERFVFVPSPGAHSLTVAATLSEVFTGIILKPHHSTSPTEAQRLIARFREHGAALLVLGEWPGAETNLRVEQKRWRGLGQGHGMLTAHELLVSSNDQRGNLTHRVRFTDGRLEAAQ